MSQQIPFVSIIIPVFNDTERLKRCLAALEQQTFPRQSFEILVVDNGSTVDPRSVIGEQPGLRFLFEQKPGSYAARNAGLAEAKGTILAFTDSDCVPQPQWLACGVARLQSAPTCGLVAGSISVFFRNPQRPTAVELYESITAFPQRKYVEKYHYGATANVFTWRSVMDQVGIFNAALTSGGDREWGQRVHAAGLELIYAEEAQVLHPARYSFAELSQKATRVTNGIERLRARQPGSFRSFAKALVQDIMPPLSKIRGVLGDKRLRNAQQRWQVVGVLLGLRYAQAWARIRARAGGLQHVR